MTESYLYRVAPQKRNLRAPDIALTTKERRHIFPVPKGWATEAPDLCVETLSSGQYGEAHAKPKVAEYLSAGAKVVWLVNPENQTVRVYAAGRQDSIYPADADITLDQVAAGFRARVSSFFPE